MHIPVFFKRGTALAAALALTCGAAFVGTQSAQAATVNETTTNLTYLQQLNTLRGKSRTPLTQAQVVAAQKADNNSVMKESQVPLEGTDGKPQPELKVNSDLMKWAETRATELANAGGNLSHDNMYNGAPDWAQEKAYNLFQSPKYEKGDAAFGPEALAFSSAGSSPIDLWASELNAQPGSKRQGYGHYLTEVSPLANIAGLSCKTVEKGSLTGGTVCALEIGYDVGKGTTQTVSEAAAANKPDPNRPSLTRLSGTLRYDTAGMVANEAFPKTASTVVLASGGNYPDALAASGLAGALDAPVMLTDANTLSNQAKEQITRLKPSRVIIVGGTAAVSTNVEQAVNKLVSAQNVTRIAGSTRYNTAAKIYEQAGHLGAEWSDTAIVTTGGGFADALSVSPYAYAKHAPIFLSDSATGLDDQTVADIAAYKFKKVIVVGGTTAVPATVESQVKNNGVKSIDRVQGWSRYATSEAIAKYAVNDGTLGVSNPVFATGANFPDALAGSSLAGSKKSVLVLTNPADTNDADVTATLNWMSQSKGSIKHGYVLGGENAVSSTVASTIADKLALNLQ